MPPDETAATTTEQSSDDIFAAAFAQLSEADTKANTSVKTIDVNPNVQPQRTEEDRATSEAQRDARAFAKQDVTGPTGPAGDATAAGTTGVTGGVTGATGSGDGGLPPDDKEKTAADKAAADAAALAATRTGPTGAPQIDDNELVKRLAGLIKSAEPVDDKTTQRTTQVDPLAMFSPEEKKFLADYEKEYPDIARAEFMRRRVENAQFATWIFGQINAALAPKFEQYDSVVTRTHAGDLQAQVPTYSNEVREKVVEWAGKQPTYKKVAYEYVINQGTVDEVADMIADWSKATGYTPPAKPGVTGGVTGGVDPAKAAQDAAKVASDAQKAAAAAKLAPVKSGNAQRAVTAIAPTDYDGAFDWATKLLEKA